MSDPAITQSEFPCKNCGAGLHFAPGQSALKCPYCGVENEIEAAAEVVEEQDFRRVLAGLEAEAETVEAVTVKCTSCGAEERFGENVVADRCAFCGAPIVASASSKRMIRPGSLLPFHVKREQAMAAFREWIDSLWFAPNDLKRYSEAGSLKGAYIPYWTYDSRTYSRYRGERGDNYTTTESYTALENGKSVRRTRTVTKIRWRSVSGDVSNAFDDVLVCATETLPRKYVETLEPWDLNNLVTYRDDYLAGFVAESYQVDLGKGFEVARGIMDAGIRASIQRDIGGDHQRIHSVNTQYNDVTFKHLLLPLWISAYLYREQSYRFLVNARTGEVCGERPYSWIKITLLVLAILIVAAVAFFFYSQGR